MPVAARAEADPGADRDVGAARERDRELERAELPASARGSAPRRTSSPCGGSTCQPARASPEISASRRPQVDLAHLGRVVGSLAQRHDRGDLDRLEGAVVEVGLELRERRDDVGAAEREAHAPARHREGLRQAVQLDRAVERPVGGEHRRRLVAVEGDVGVGEVVHEHELALARQVDELLHQLGRRDRGRRVVRERDDHHARRRLRGTDGLLDRRRARRRRRCGAWMTVAPASRGATRWIG